MFIAPSVCAPESYRGRLYDVFRQIYGRLDTVAANFVGFRAIALETQGTGQSGIRRHRSVFVVPDPCLLTSVS
jgi:hypothetical protein